MSAALITDTVWRRGAVALLVGANVMCSSAKPEPERRTDADVTAAESLAVQTTPPVPGECLGAQPLLTVRGLGSIRLGDSFERVRALCPHFRDSIDEVGEQLVLVGAVGSSMVVVSSAEGVPDDPPEVTWILVIGGSIRTDRGVGPGSTLAAVVHQYSGLRYNLCRDGSKVHGIDTEDAPGMYFAFSDCQLPGYRDSPSVDTTQSMISITVAIPHPDFQEEPDNSDKTPRP